jgi:hypothetical protein
METNEARLVYLLGVLAFAVNEARLLGYVDAAHDVRHSLLRLRLDSGLVLLDTG